MRSYLGDIPNAHVRDFQRQRVYNAEEQCNFWQDGLRNPPLGGDEVEALVAKIALWASIKQPNILYEAPSKIPIAYATHDSVVLPFDRASSLPYICHEMAHCINYNSDNADHHGRHFSLTYLNLVKQFISRTASVELRKAFRNNRVKYAKA